MATPVVIHVLASDPTRVCIHWLYDDPEGPIHTADNTIQTAAGPRVVAQGRRFRCACQPERTNIGTVDAGKLVPFPHSDDPRAVTCPKCIASEKYKTVMQEMENIVPVKGGIHA